MSDPDESFEQLPRADWTDQDLLSKDLARNLLDSEIEAEEKRLAGAAGDSDDVYSRDAAERRLRDMIEVRDRLS